MSVQASKSQALAGALTSADHYGPDPTLAVFRCSAGISLIFPFCLICAYSGACLGRRRGQARAGKSPTKYFFDHPPR